MVCRRLPQALPWQVRHEASLIPFVSICKFQPVKSGMKLLDNVRDDDIFLLLDADELPNPESLMFLKLFDGWVS